MKTKAKHLNLTGAVLTASIFSLLGGSVFAPMAYAAGRSTNPRQHIQKTQAQSNSLSTAFVPDAIDAAGNYGFSTGTNASFTDMSSGTTQLIGPDVNDFATPLTNIGFDFFFQGALYTQFSVNDNGLIRLGGVVQLGPPYKALAQHLVSIITPYGANQRTHAIDGKVHYKVTGTAPSRTLVVEWRNNQADLNAGGTADLTYQANLHETTGAIDFVYGPMTMSAAGAADNNSKDPDIGFASSNNPGTVGSVLAPQSGVPAPTFDSTSANGAHNIYTAGTITVLNSTADGSRRFFSFAPPIPTAPTNLTFTAVGPTSMTLNWIDSPDELLYAIYRSTDGVNFVLAGTAAQNATSFAATGLNQGTLYFWRVYAVSEGALSTPLSGSRATGVTGTPT